MAKPNEPVHHFRDAEAFSAWLPTATGAIWIKIAKQGSTVVTLSQREAIDCALCHGWIDGQIQRFDDEVYLTRFTPRKAGSRWSANNRHRAEELIAAGRMSARGLAEVEAAKRDGRWDAAYPSASAAATPADFEAALAGSPTAGARYAALDGANRYALLYRLHHAKTPPRREEMIAKFVAMLERGETIHEPRKSRPKKA